MVIVSRLTKRFGGRPVVDNVNMSLMPGLTHVIAGPNGSGKSTLLRLLAGFETPCEGTIQGRPVNGEMTYVAQHPYLFSGTVAKNLTFSPRSRHLPPETMADLARRLGITELLPRTARLLSGGESRMVAFARALACRPRLLLLDEPTADLDKENGRRIIDELSRQADNNVTIVVATHDPILLERGDVRIVRFEHGRVAEDRTA